MKSSTSAKPVQHDLLACLRKLAGNLWWSWNADAAELLASVDPALFAATNQNPLRTIKLLTPARIEAIQHDAGFARRLEAVEKQLAKYLAAPREKLGELKIAYFCAEFAVHESLPQYSGGLGVLAGDHVKSASDLGLPFVGVGLLYRRGYYVQEFAADGATRVIYPTLDFSELPLVETGKTINVPMARGKIAAKIWRQTVGRLTLFLLDTDIPQNKAADRMLTHHLYGGDREYRIRQEILLGVGGVLALDAIGEKANVFHMNEGHAAFAALERVAKLTRAGMSVAAAIQRVASSNVFTTHTPVPAGNDRFDPKLALKYIGRYARDMRISPHQLLALGREDGGNDSEEFCMTVLALRLSRHCNGVSALHGEVSREMWKRVYNATDAKDVPIRHVTNGVHARTWLAPEMIPIHERYPDPAKIPDQELWSIHCTLKRKLVRFARQRLADQAIRRGDAAGLRNASDALDENALTIGFARRFATYKRAPLIFKQASHLAKILGDSKRPVQIIFAGKAHPKDMGGQIFAAEIHRYAQSAAFAGRVVLLEDYDMNVARYLVGGCEVWLNNPIRPQEASGTSGMKPPLHGGLNCSILDGWWPECFDDRNGWAIGDGSQLDNQAEQDRLDAVRICRLLEKQIVPLFYQRDSSGLPRKWIAMMKHSMATVGKTFNTHRMVEQYLKEFYLPAFRA
jgi:glycogen phosphorylase